MKNSLILLTIFMCATSTIAQKSKFSVFPNFGVTKPILDGGLGFHAGVNPSYKLSNRFALEGQVSFSYTDISSAFLSGKRGSVSASNFLTGGRLYLNPNSKKSIFYLNLLAGLNVIKEKSEGLVLGTEYGFGFSTGGFVNLSGLTLGITYDTPQNLVLKLGLSL